MALTDALASGISSFERDEVVKITLSDASSDDHLSVSKALLCSASDYFEKALNGSFVESTTKALTLPDCDLDTFRLFLYYLSHNATLPNLAPIAEQQKLLVRLWFFADAYLMPKLKNEAMRHLLIVIGWDLVDIDAVELAASKVGHESILFKSLVDQIAYDLVDGGYTMTAAEMQTLGAIPGFWQLYQTGIHDRCPKTKEREMEQYFVQIADKEEG